MSFRRRLTLLTAGAVAVAVAVAAGAAYLLVGAELRGQVDDSLRERAVGARGAIEAAPFGADGPAGTIVPGGQGNRGPTGAPRGPGGPLFGGPGPGSEAFPEPGLGGPETAGQLVDGSGEVVRSNGLDGATLPVEPAVELLGSGQQGPSFSDATVEGTKLRVITLAVGPETALQLARSLEEVDSALNRLALIMALVAAGGIGAATALGLAVSRAALRPVRELTVASEEVARTEDLSRRIEIEGDDELARLGASFNSMLAALERSVGAQRQLVADASHELRTPLTSLRTNIETLSRSPAMPAADRERLLTDLESELAELGRLVDDIVDLAREGAETGSAAEHVDARLDEIVAACVDRTRRRVATGVTLESRLEPTVVRGAPERLDRAVGNLLDNAAKWTPADGRIEIELAGGRLTIADSGPGIAPEDLPHVFDRFYRAAAARGTPGSGLGLAIVEQVAEAHGGTVSAGASASGGAELILALPPQESPELAPEAGSQLGSSERRT